MLAILYKIGQILGSGATFVMASYLLLYPKFFEPNPIIRWFEIIGLYLASGILFLDALDIHPFED